MKKINIIIFGIVSCVLFAILLVGIIIAFLNDNNKYYLDISKYDKLTDVDCDKDTYLLMPYTANYQSSDEEESKNTQKLLNNMLSTVKECKKKYNIGFYLIDFDRFGKELKSQWKLTKLPAYYVFTKEKGENIYLYSGYGLKTAYELQDEINKVIEYDLPVNDVGSSRKINESLNAILYSYKIEDNKTDANIVIDFHSSEQMDYKIEKDSFEILDYKSKESCAEIEEVTTLESLNQGSNDISLKIKIKNNYDLEHITIKYSINSNKYVMWHYNKWITESES